MPVDTDFGELNDDSQAPFMLLQGGVDVLGVTTVTGIPGRLWASRTRCASLSWKQAAHPGNGGLRRSAVR
ncbi:MAG: nucleoside hydrolase [Pseudonocardia sp.]|nr:nucleoside hydrolase [Pseudonocardia sp.]